MQSQTDEMRSFLNNNELRRQEQKFKRWIYYVLIQYLNVVHLKKGTKSTLKIVCKEISIVINVLGLIHSSSE